MKKRLLKNLALLFISLAFILNTVTACSGNPNITDGPSDEVTASPEPDSVSTPEPPKTLAGTVREDGTVDITDMCVPAGYAVIDSVFVTDRELLVFMINEPDDLLKIVLYNIYTGSVASAFEAGDLIESNFTPLVTLLGDRKFSLCSNSGSEMYIFEDYRALSYPTVIDLSAYGEGAYDFFAVPCHNSETIFVLGEKILYRGSYDASTLTKYVDLSDFNGYISMLGITDDDRYLLLSCYSYDNYLNYTYFVDTQSGEYSFNPSLHSRLYIDGNDYVAYDYDEDYVKRYSLDYPKGYSAVLLSDDFESILNLSDGKLLTAFTNEDLSSLFMYDFELGDCAFSYDFQTTGFIRCVSHSAENGLIAVAINKYAYQLAEENAADPDSTAEPTVTAEPTDTPAPLDDPDGYYDDDFGDEFIEESFEQSTSEFLLISTVDKYTPSTNIIMNDPYTFPEEITAEATRISEKYGVRIFLGSEAIRAFSDFKAQPVRSASYVKQALASADEVLGSFPEGFFKELTTGYLSHLDILMLGNLTSTDSSSTSYPAAYGYPDEAADALTVAMNIESVSVKTNLAHELMHLIESKMLHDGNYFNDWFSTAYLPSGFSYNLSYRGEDGFDYYDSAYTYYGETALDRMYFVDAYSKTFPNEDRARLFENLFCYDPSDDNASSIFNAPHLRARAKYLCDMIRSSFKTVQAVDQAHWERVFADYE